VAVNHVTRRYVEQSAGAGSALRDAGRTAPFLPTFGNSFNLVLLPRPMFLAQSVVDTATADLNLVHDAITGLPDRLFDGDLRRYYAGLNMDARSAGILLRTATGRAPRYARADMIYDGTGLRLVEYNVGSELGGLQLGEMGRGLMQVPEFRDFAQAHQLSYQDSAAEVAAVLRRAGAPVTGGRDPVVAVVEWTGQIPAAPGLYVAFQEVMAAQGIEVLLADVTEVRNRDGKLYLGDRAIDVALRYFMLAHVLSRPDGAEVIEPILRAHEDGGTVLFADLETTAFAYKDNLVYLSDPRYRQVYSPAEAAAIDRVLPWTRRVLDEVTEAEGTRVKLLDYCVARQESLVLKPHDGYAAVGTFAGWETSAQQWRSILDDHADGSYIVQHRVVPQVEPMLDPDTAEMLDCVPVYGVFLTERGYAGMFNRVQGPGRTAVISGLSGIGVTNTFTYPG